MTWHINQPVVVPFDFSDHSKQAVELAVKLADDPGRVHVLHVLPFLIPTEPGVVWGTIDDSSRIDHALEAMREALPEPKFGQVAFEVRLGDPGSVAAQRAEELSAGLMVVGSHGRTGISRMVLGSVAERVTRLAPCPVLVVKLTTGQEPAGEPTAQQAASA